MVPMLLRERFFRLVRTFSTCSVSTHPPRPRLISFSIISSVPASSAAVSGNPHLLPNSFRLILFKRFCSRITVSTDNICGNIALKNSRKNSVKTVVKIMSSCNVKILPAESQEDRQERVSISLELVRGSSIKNFNLCRLKSEPLGTAMDRLQINLAKKLLKKPKKKKQKKTHDAENSGSIEKDESEIIPVVLSHGQKPVDLSISNEDAWIDGACLKIEDEEIIISYNTPSVKLEELYAVTIIPLAKKTQENISFLFAYQKITKNKGDVMLYFQRAL